jgi:predicted MFS family arabinose efflux permease
VILGLLILIAGFVLVRRDRASARLTRRFDLTGALTVTAGMVALVYSMVHIGEPDDRAWAFVAVGLAAALLTAFVLVERRAAEPLLRPGLLRNLTLVRADTAAVLFAGGFFGFQFVAALYLQELRGWSPVETGLAFLVMGLDLLLAPVLTPGLVRRFGTTRVILAGSLVATVGYALFLRAEADWGYLDMLPTLVLIGVAFALVYGPLTSEATDQVPESEQGVAGALLNTSIQFGAAFGLAAVTSVLVASGDGPTTISGYRDALLAPTLMALVATVVIASGLRRRE